MKIRSCLQKLIRIELLHISAQSTEFLYLAINLPKTRIDENINTIEQSSAYLPAYINVSDAYPIVIPVFNWKWSDVVIRKESELRSKWCRCRYIH